MASKNLNEGYTEGQLGLGLVGLSLGRRSAKAGFREVDEMVPKFSSGFRKANYAPRLDVNIHSILRGAISLLLGSTGLGWMFSTPSVASAIAENTIFLWSGVIFAFFVSIGIMLVGRGIMGFSLLPTRSPKIFLQLPVQDRPTTRLEKR